jgi:Putative DNA-binding domain
VPVSSPTELIRALVEDDFDRLLGTLECDWLDFKETFPNLSDPRGKWELAKDVAAFANVGTSYIVFGVRTEKHVNETVEAAGDIAPLLKRDVDVDACRKVIQSLVYPPLPGVAIDFYPNRSDEDEALVVIEIGRQDPGSFPFMLRKALDPEGAVKGGVAIPVRDGDQTRWWSAEEIHELISHGLRRPPGRLPEPNLPPGRPMEEPAEGASGLVDRVVQLVDRIEVVQEWEESPVYSLMATPGRTADLVPKLFGDRGLTSLLRDPPSLRQSGFNLQTGGNLETLEGATMARSGNNALVLDPTGPFAAVVPGDRSFLQWAINDRVFPESHRINTLTLVEFTYEFFRFAVELQARSGVDDWRFRLEARRFRSASVVLEEGVSRRGSIAFLDNREAMDDSWTQAWRDMGPPGRNATMALTYFYALFQLGSDAFRDFTRDGEVSAEAILEVAAQLR